MVFGPGLRQGGRANAAAFAEVLNLMSKVWLAGFKITYKVVAISLETIPLQTLTLLQSCSEV
jgi:hypothetical protein